MNITLHFPLRANIWSIFHASMQFSSIFVAWLGWAGLGWARMSNWGWQWLLPIIIKITSRATFHLVVALALYHANLDHASLWVLAFCAALHLL